MPEQVGKIIRIRNKFAGPPTLAVNTVGEGLRKHINLCFACRLFRPNEPGHCRVAQQLFELCTSTGIATALVRCPEFVPTNGVDVQDSSHRE